MYDSARNKSLEIITYLFGEHIDPIDAKYRLFKIQLMISFWKTSERLM